MKNLVKCLLFLAAVNSYAWVDLSEDELEKSYDLCSTYAGIVESYYLQQETLAGNVSLSIDYKQSAWESSEQSWDFARYPLLVKVPNYFLCAFNLKTNEHIHMVSN